MSTAVLIRVNAIRFLVNLANCGHPLKIDTSLLRTVFFVVGESPYIFSKFNPPNTVTRLSQARSSVPPKIPLMNLLFES